MAFKAVLLVLFSFISYGLCGFVTCDTLPDTVNVFGGQVHLGSRWTINPDDLKTWINQFCSQVRNTPSKSLFDVQLTVPGTGVHMHATLNSGRANTHCVSALNDIMSKCLYTPMSASGAARCPWRHGTWTDVQGAVNEKYQLSMDQSDIIANGDVSLPSFPFRRYYLVEVKKREGGNTFGLWNVLTTTISTGRLLHPKLADLQDRLEGHGSDMDKAHPRDRTQDTIRRIQTRFRRCSNLMKSK